VIGRRPTPESTRDGGRTGAATDDDRAAVVGVDAPLGD
jgi:hypothetical protein